VRAYAHALAQTHAPIALGRRACARHAFALTRTPLACHADGDVRDAHGQALSPQPPAARRGQARMSDGVSGAARTECAQPRHRQGACTLPPAAASLPVHAACGVRVSHTAAGLPGCNAAYTRFGVAHACADMLQHTAQCAGGVGPLPTRFA
jgi:hypothetical protein